MVKNRFLALFKMNLIYMTPQYTAQLRKKGKSGKKLVRGLLFQQVALSILYFLMYSSMVKYIDFNKNPGFFTFYIALFSLMTIAQSVAVIFNVFYESNDLKDFLALPFNISEVFFAKFLIVGMSILPYLLPIFSIFFFTASDANIPSAVAFLFSLLLFFIFSISLYTFCIWIISSFAQTAFFRRHQKMMTTGVMILTTAGMLGGIFYLNFKTSPSTLDLSDAPKIFFLMPLHEAIVKPTSLTSLAVVLSLILFISLATYFIFKTVIPTFYQQSSQHISHKVKRKKAGRSLQKMLISYNLNLIKDPTLLMQTITVSTFLPIAWFFPFSVSEKINLTDVPIDYAGAFILGGVGLSYICISSYSLVSVIISLDQERFLFMKSLPLSFKSYLKIKFWTMTILQFLFISLMAIGMIFLSKVPLLLGGCALLGIALGIYLLSEFYFYRDYRLLTLNWTNITQLFTRGGGNLTRMILTFVGFFVSFLVIGLFGLLIHFAPILGNTLIGCVLLGAFIGVKIYFNRTFWQKFD